MACGLPVIVSSRAGVSELIKDGSSGLLLRDPTNVEELTNMVRRLVLHPAEAELVGRNAAQTAVSCSWEQSAAALWQLLEQSYARKRAVLPRKVSAVNT